MQLCSHVCRMLLWRLLLDVCILIRIDSYWESIREPQGLTCLSLHIYLFFYVKTVFSWTHVRILFSFDSFFSYLTQQFFFIWPCVGRVYPLNLSISLGGGKETNRDSLSRGDRKGRSPTRSPRVVVERRQWQLAVLCWLLLPTFRRGCRVWECFVDVYLVDVTIPEWLMER